MYITDESGPTQVTEWVAEETNLQQHFKPETSN